MTVCSYHVTYAFQNESTLYSCLIVKELFAQSRRKIWSLIDCNWTQTRNHLVHKQTLISCHICVSEWIHTLKCIHECSVCLWTKWLWVPWHSGNYRVWIHSEITMIQTYSQIQRTDKYSQQISIICPVWLNGWVFIYELGGCGFESSCRHLNFKFCACFEQRVPWHSGNYRVSIHSEMHVTW